MKITNRPVYHQPPIIKLSVEVIKRAEKPVEAQKPEEIKHPDPKGTGAKKEIDCYV